MSFTVTPFYGPNRNSVPKWITRMNKVTGKLGVPYELRPRFDHRHHMVSLEQASNFEHLINRVIDTEVRGDFVELGSYTGSTATLIADLLQRQHGDRTFHVYDRFDIELGSQRNIQDIFVHTFAECGLSLPVLHIGDLWVTLPSNLPSEIAFVHIDCGTGMEPKEHAKLITHCLESVHPRLSHGAVAIFMDYHVPGKTLDGNDSNPGVRLACDTFFADKPEQIQLMYGGACSHAYIRKL